MNKTATLALAAVALGLLAYILVYERDSLTSSELMERRGRLLETFVRERVAALEVERGGRTLRLVRERGEQAGWEPWRVAAPWQDEADIDAVNALLGELEWLDARRTLQDVSDADLERFGLRKPRLKLWYEAGGERQLLEVGDEDVHGEGVYVRLGGAGPVKVVPKTLDEVLDHPLSHFRTKQFLGDFTAAWGRFIDIETAEQTVRLRREDGTWWYENEPRGYGDPRAIEQWLRGFDDLRASRYVPEEQVAEVRAALEQAPRSLLVKVIPDAGREDAQIRVFDLRVGDVCGEHGDERHVTVGEDGPVVCVDEATLEPLFDEPTALRLHSLLPFDPSEVESFRFATGPHTLRLTREGEGWVAREGEVGEIDRVAVEGWLRDLGARTATGFEERVEGPAVSIVDFSRADGEGYRLELGRPRLEGSLVRRGAEPISALYGPLTADLLTLWEGRFRPLELWPGVQPSQVVGLEVAASGGAPRVLRRVEGQWREPEAPGPAADAARVREIVRDLAQLEAVRFRVPAPDPRHGLGDPELQLKATLEADEGEAPRVLTLDVGARSEASGNHFVQVDAGPVAELSLESVAMLRELLEAPPEAEKRSAQPAATAPAH